MNYYLVEAIVNGRYEQVYVEGSDESAAKENARRELESLRPYGTLEKFGRVMFVSLPEDPYEGF